MQIGSFPTPKTMRRTSVTFLVIAGVLAAQSQPTYRRDGPARPRIGLVLSGGGALGLAHVGVLQWFEEHRIPVAYVGGTSMGGLVGALFATGHNSMEMREFIDSIDWASAFNPAPPFREVAFRRKEDRREFPNVLQLGLRNGVRLPSSLSSGHEVGLVLSRFAAPYAEIRSFDELPTPFRCVATNLLNGQEVVFSQGPLGTALRATMSLPAIFAPVEVDNMLLADGGLLNNLPVQVVKDMGADIIIAVPLVDPDSKKESLASLLHVSRRSIALMIDANERRSMTLADLLVSPDLTGFTSKDFARYEEMVRRGYESAEKKKSFLSTLAVSESEYAEYVAERNRRRLPRTITPTFVTVRGEEGLRQHHIEEALEKELTGRRLQHDAIERRLTEVAGLGPYLSASYGFVKQGSAEGIRVDAVRKSYSPPILDTGVNIEGTQTGNIRFGFGARLTYFDFWRPGSELRADLTIGLNNSIGSEYYYRMGSSRWFVAPRGYYSRRQEDVYTGKDVTSILRVREANAGSDLGLAVSRFQELRVGYEYSYIKPSISSGVFIPGLSQAAGNMQTTRLRWAYDGQDSNTVPRHGFRSTMEARWNFTAPSGTPQYGTAEGRLSWANSFGPQYSIVSGMNGGTIVGPGAYLPPFTLGGPGNLSAIGRGQMRGERYYHGSVQALRAFSPERGNFLNNVYLDAGFEAGRAFSDAAFIKPVYDGLAGVVVASPVGVIFVGGSYGSSGNHRFFFRIGRAF